MSQLSGSSRPNAALQHLLVVSNVRHEVLRMQGARDAPSANMTQLIAQDVFGERHVRKERTGSDTPASEAEDSADRIHLMPLSPEGSPMHVFAAYSASSSSRGGAYVYPQPPAVLDRYPLTDTKELALPIALSMFCQPLGALYRRSPAGCRFLTFVLTGAMGDQVHATALQFYERRNVLVSSASSENDADDGAAAVTPFYALRSLVTLSPWPFYHNFQEALVHLHALAGDALSIPWERYLVNLFEAPAPPPHVAVHLTLGSHVIKFWRPDATGLPPLRFPSDLLFRYLSVRNVVQLLTLIMLETKVVVHSRNECLLNPVLESLMDLLMPMSWTNVYVPVFPEQLADYLQAFIPFVLGMTTETYHRLDDSGSVPDEIAIVDLDANKIDPKREIPWLPVHQALMDRLTSILTSLDAEYRTSFVPDTPMSTGGAAGAITERRISLSPFVTPDRPVKHLPQVVEHNNAIREAFLHFMCRLLARYNEHLQPPEPGSNVSELFNKDSFCAAMGEGSRSFYSMLFTTITFTKLIEDRVYSSDVDGRFVFFDSHMELVLQSEPRPAAAAKAASGATVTTWAQGSKTMTPASRSKQPPPLSHSTPSAPVLTASTTKSKVRQQRVAERVYTVPPANAASVPSDAVFTYPRFPRFDKSAFVPLRPTRSSALIALGGGGGSVGPAAPTLSRRTTRGASSALISVGPSPRRSRLALAARPSQTGGSGPISSSSGQLVPNALQSRQAALSACDELKTAVFCAWFRLYASAAVRRADARAALAEGLCVLWQLKEAEGLVADPLVYQFLLEVCGKRGLADEARYILRDMSAAGVRGDAVAYGWHVQAIAGAATADQQAASRKKKAPSTLFETPLRMQSLVMRADAHCSDCDRELSEAEIMAGWSNDEQSSMSECPSCQRPVHARIAIDPGRGFTVDNAPAQPPSTFDDATVRVVDDRFDVVPAAASVSSSDTSLAASAAAVAASSSSTFSQPARPWYARHVPATVTLLKPAVLFAELSAVLRIDRRIVQSKEAFLAEYPLLFWNCVWYFAALDIPFDAAGLARLRASPAASAFATVMPATTAPTQRTFFGSLWSRSSNQGPANGNNSVSASPSVGTLGVTSSTAQPTANPTNLLLPALVVFGSGGAGAGGSSLGLGQTSSLGVTSANVLATASTTGIGHHHQHHGPAYVSSAATGLRRRLAGWPRRRYAVEAPYAHLSWTDARDAAVLRVLTSVQERMAAGQLAAAMTEYLRARAEFRDERVFQSSCYDHLVTAALRPPLLPPKPRKRTLQPSLMLPQQASNMPYADGDSIDFLMTEALEPAPSADEDDFVILTTGTTTSLKVPKAATQSLAYESEMDVADAYKAAVMALDEDLRDLLTPVDDTPSDMVLTLRAVFPQLRL